MAEATLTATEESVSVPAPDNVSAPPELESTTLVDPVEAASPAAAEPEAPPAEPPAPEPPAERTLRDIYNDVQAGKAVPPSEYQALQNYAADVKKREDAERERQQKLATLIPDTAQGILEDITSRYAFDEDQKLVLQTLIEKRLLHGDDALKGKAEEAILGHHVNTQAGQLYAYLGGDTNPNALPYLRNLKPEQYISSAFDAGKIIARRDLIASGEFVPKKELEEVRKNAREAALREVEAINPERVSGLIGGGRSGAAGKLYSEMTAEERAGLSPADRDRLVAQEIASRQRS